MDWLISIVSTMSYFISKLMSGLSNKSEMSKLLSIADRMVCVAICQVAVHLAADFMGSPPPVYSFRSPSASLTLSSLSDAWSDKIDKPGTRA